MGITLRKERNEVSQLSYLGRRLQVMGGPERRRAMRGGDGRCKCASCSDSLGIRKLKTQLPHVCSICDLPTGPPLASLGILRMESAEITTSDRRPHVCRGSSIVNSLISQVPSCHSPLLHSGVAKPTTDFPDG